MKVGMIFECGPMGADKKVCEYLARQLEPTIEISSVTLDRKPRLIADCGRSAAQLLKEGCERVVIIWDLHPAWRDTKPCRKEDREKIIESLTAAGVDQTKVFLVCIEEELEAWLIADNKAIEDVLSRPKHKARVDDVRRPQQMKNPKRHLSQIYGEYGRRYNDLIDAIKIVSALTDFNKLKRCDTFVRFALKVADKKL